MNFRDFDIGCSGRTSQHHLICTILSFAKVLNTEEIGDPRILGKVAMMTISPLLLAVQI